MATASPPTAPAHGGARPNAGRPPLPYHDRGGMRPITLYVAADHVRSLRALGDGNVSLGLRRLMEAVAAEQSEQEESTHGQHAR